MYDLRAIKTKRILFIFEFKRRLGMRFLFPLFLYLNKFVNQVNNGTRNTQYCTYTLTSRVHGYVNQLANWQDARWAGILIMKTYCIWLCIVSLWLVVLSSGCVPATGENTDVANTQGSPTNTATVIADTPKTTHTPKATAIPPIPPTFTVTPTPIIVNTPEATATQAFSSLGIKMVYLTFRPASLDQPEQSRIWLLEPPFLAPRLVYEFGTGVGFGAGQYWAHDGQQIAFIQIINGNYLLTLLNVSTLDKREFALKEIDEDENKGIIYLEWSEDDQWIAINTSDSTYDKFDTFIFNIENRKLQKLETGAEFVSWSEKNPVKYMYLHHLFQESFTEDAVPDIRSIRIGEVGQETPSISVFDMGDKAPKRAFSIAWKPDESKVIAISHDSNGATSVYELDITTNTLKNLRNYPERLTPGSWSPDGRWLEFNDGNLLLLWDTAKNEQPVLIELPNQNRRIIKGWTTDSRFLIYQEGDYLYAIEPEQPQSPILLFDLSQYRIIGDPAPSVKLWIAPLE